MVSNYIRGNDMPKLTPSKDCYQCNKANISKVYAWRYLKDHLFNTDYFNKSECKITFNNKYNFAFIYKNKIMSTPLISKVRFSGAKPGKNWRVMSGSAFSIFARSNIRWLSQPLGERGFFSYQNALYGV